MWRDTISFMNAVHHGTEWITRFPEPERLNSALAERYDTHTSQVRLRVADLDGVSERLAVLEKASFQKGKVIFD